MLDFSDPSISAVEGSFMYAYSSGIDSFKGSACLRVGLSGGILGLGGYCSDFADTSPEWKPYKLQPAHACL